MSGARHKKGLWLDPRAKLFLILICVLASMFAPSLVCQFALVALIAILGTFFGKWKCVIKAVCFYAVICVLTVWIMAEMTGTLRTMFIAFLGLFHKVYACGMLAGIVLSTTKVNEFLSAMNRVHAPKKLVIPLAVMLRYIPTIREDWRYIKDAMRMRDVCDGCPPEIERAVLCQGEWLRRRQRGWPGSIRWKGEVIYETEKRK